MDPKHRVVTRIPVSELWIDGHTVTATRGRDLNEEEVRNLLRSGRVVFVVADVGQQLEWIPQEKTFVFWKDEVMSRLSHFPMDPRVVQDHIYVASEWTSSDGAIIALLEKYH